MTLVLCLYLFVCFLYLYKKVSGTCFYDVFLLLSNQAQVLYFHLYWVVFVIHDFVFVLLFLVFVFMSICINVYVGEAEIWPWF